jgi:hypothetical protein
MCRAVALFVCAVVLGMVGLMAGAQPASADDDPAGCCFVWTANTCDSDLQSECAMIPGGKFYKGKRCSNNKCVD